MPAEIAGGKILTLSVWTSSGPDHSLPPWLKPSRWLLRTPALFVSTRAFSCSGADVGTNLDIALAVVLSTLCLRFKDFEKLFKLER